MKPSGLIIGVLGRDGCGKSTFVSEIHHCWDLIMKEQLLFKKNSPRFLYKGEIFKKKVPYDFFKNHITIKREDVLLRLLKLNVLLIEFSLVIWFINIST
jgi:ABC-type phosphate/phosphonate transport system ATPase subunit